MSSLALRFISNKKKYLLFCFVQQPKAKQRQETNHDTGETSIYWALFFTLSTNRSSKLQIFDFIITVVFTQK